MALATVASAFIAGAASSHAAIIAGVTYTYDNKASLALAHGPDNNYSATSDPNALSGALGNLTDGQGQAGVYVPGTFFWGTPELGTIYNHADANIPSVPQPQLTFTLPGTYNLSSVTIHYGVRTASAVEAPSSADIAVGGGGFANHTGFDNTASVNNFGDIRSNTINLGGAVGSSVTIQIRGTQSPLAGTAWLGLTEIEFDGTLIPEPAAGLFLGLGAFGLVLRRRRRL